MPRSGKKPAQAQRSLDLSRHAGPRLSALFANIEGGATVDEFIEWFPGVSREQVNLVLEHAARSLSEPVSA